MAIVKMNKITVYGMIRDRDKVLKLLHKAGAVQIEKIDDEALGRENTDRLQSRISHDTELVSKALDILSEYAPIKKPFLKAREHSSPDARIDKANLKKCCEQLISLKKQIDQNSDDIRKIDERQSSLIPYYSLDIPLNVNETNSTYIKAGKVQGLVTADDIERLSQEFDDLKLHAEILSSSKEQTALWIIYRKDSDNIEEFLQRLRFEEFSLKTPSPPEEAANRLEKQRQVLERDSQTRIEKIKSLADNTTDLQLMYDTLLLKQQRCDALSDLGRTRYVFVLNGYLPQKRTREITDILENHNCVCETESAEGLEDTPKAFKNGGFASAVEGITETYSMPSPHDIDPNPIMAFFYYLFFGMMFSDAGYGLLVMIVCGILAFGNRLEKRQKNMFRMFFFCGISTTFWGFMYGSFFGNVISTVSETFLGHTAVLRPLWIDPVSEPLKLLIFSVILGLIQILVGMGINFYMLMRERKIADAFFNVGLWMMVLIFAATLAAGMGFSNIILADIGKYGLLAGAIGLICTQGRHNTGFFSKLFGGVISLYNVTSYVSDILSYSRLMALGLATGVIANVVNILGSISGNVVIFILISIVGHSMNFAINMLGAYVHTNRLQYVEFYSKFYEGGGRAFKPFALKTKYYNFE